MDQHSKWLEERLDALEERVTRLEAPAPVPVPSYSVSPRPSVTMPAAPISRSQENFESTIGRWWLGIAGVIVLLFGVGFFLKFAFENNYIGPAARVILGLVAGAVLLVLGEEFKKRIPKYSYILTGGGLGLLYLSLFAAFNYYALVSLTMAFIAMILVTGLGVLLALKNDSIEVAGLSTFGGFLTPFLLSSATPHHAVFFGYLIMVSLALVALAFFKKWPALVLIGFIMTLANFASWLIAFYTIDLLAFTLLVSSLLFVVYLLAVFITALSTKDQTEPRDLLLTTIIPVFYFGLWYQLLTSTRFDSVLGLFAAALGVLYVVLAALAFTTKREDRNLVLFLGGIAFVFFTITMPLQFKQNAITMAWAAEAFVLYLIGLAIKDVRVRWAALIVFVVAVIRLLVVDSSAPSYDTFTIIFNRRFLTYIVVAAASLAMVWAYSQNREKITEEDRGTPVFLWLMANALLLIALTLDVTAYFDSQAYMKAQSNRAREYYNSYDTNGLLPLAVPYNLTQDRSLQNQRNASVSVLWTLYAALLLGVGIARKKAYLRWSALALFGITVIKVFAIDLAGLDTIYRVVSFIVLGCLLLVGSFLYFRLLEKTPHQNT